MTSLSEPRRRPPRTSKKFKFRCKCKQLTTVTDDTYNNFLSVVGVFTLGSNGSLQIFGLLCAKCGEPPREL